MSTICFDPMELKGLAEVVIERGGDREFVYNVIQRAHVANCHAYAVRYDEPMPDVYDLRDSEIHADTKSFLAKSGIGHLIYNLDDSVDARLEDDLYLIGYEDRSFAPRSSRSAGDLQRYAEWVIEAIGANQPNVAGACARKAATCALESGHLRVGDPNRRYQSEMEKRKARDK